MEQAEHACCRTPHGLALNGVGVCPAAEQTDSALTAGKPRTAMLLAVAGRVWFKLLLTIWPGDNERGSFEDRLTAAVVGVLGPLVTGLATPPRLQASPDWCAYCKRESTASNRDLKV